MLAHLLFYYAEAYYRGGVTDLDDWEEVAIQYKQGINTTLGDLLGNEKQMEDFLLRLSGNLKNWKGTSMFFQYGKQRCTPVAWATKKMSWKIILPLELVKPMLWAAATQTSRSGSVSSTSRNQSTQFWLPIPIRNSTLDLLWPHEQARRQQHAKRQRRDVGSHHERSPTADLFLIEPHVWSENEARGEHDVKFATDMNNLYKASQGYVEPGKDKMPDWWYDHFWDDL